KKLFKHIDKFNKLIGDLANLDVDIDNGDQALMLLISLPHSYDNFVETLLYGMESLTLEDVLSSLNHESCKRGQMQRMMVMGGTSCLILRSSMVVLLGDNRACAIRGTGKTESGEASVGIQKKESFAQVWHKRLGHISEAGLHKLERREVMGNKGLEGVVDYVYTDLEGPSLVESISGCRYLLSIIDDYSRRG
nr:retrovirus-related Pol polyprotein from transposon TNT 1-94 [Tanacetum cinerariifolium]